MTFEWDDAKALANERKHGVTFSEARTVFGDAFALHLVDGLHSWSEERFIIIGCPNSFAFSVSCTWNASRTHFG